MTSNKTSSHLAITFLGAGRIAKALIQGLLNSNSVSPDQITVVSQSGISAKAVAKTYGVRAVTDPSEAIKQSSVIFLCTKPLQALDALASFYKPLQGKLIISVVTGIYSNDLLKASDGQARIIRAMPNTAIRLGKGVTTLTPHISATTEDLALAMELFSSVGTVYQIQEDEMNATTAVSGSGPAFALLFLEGMIEGALHVGLDPSLARKLSAHAMVAAAALVLETEVAPETLRAEITSPKGTTEAGLKELQKIDFSKTVQTAIEAAAARAEELTNSATKK